MPLFILVAEDDPAIRLSINDYLEFNGYSVITAENGEQALSMLEKYHPHLLISDIKMPYKNGYELIKNIRRLPQYRLLPVIFLSEFSETTARIHGYQVGCDAYLPKPFAMEELGAIIRNLLERSQAIHSEIIFSQGDRLEPANTIPESAKLPAVQKDHDLSKLYDKLKLTQRETEVLELLIEGRSNIEIGKQLHLSPRTIEKYVSSLLRKSDLNNRIELICYAMEYHTS
ncbi:MAG: response regulator transcription factor [Pleurocapsa sp. SU_5_0]|nr:response regulator transcription factor [Pleurocapsa sp. SU_5_0]NJO97044.1 response regulator transcription factor [Pleurocapsa sp. CRU_1_2]NJR46084.1 response regulator transcription factor [Hyellaceae cyanobacterium CSU_1_1]